MLSTVASRSLVQCRSSSTADLDGALFDAKTDALFNAFCSALFILMYWKQMIPA